MIRRTSLSTYKAIVMGGLLSAKRMAVYEYLFNHGPRTGSEVQLALRSNNSVSESVRNRITELVQMGAVYEVGETKDPVTGRSVLLFDVTEKMPIDFKKKESKADIYKMALKNALWLLRNGVDTVEVENFIQEKLLEEK